MIVAVEGPSAAGKSTWCSSQGWPVVAEYRPTGREPDGTAEHDRTANWTGINAGRWLEAVQFERKNRVVLCDRDPLKLHYSWCLARVGAVSPGRFEHELAHVRAAFVRGQLGLADAVRVSIPPPQILAERRDGDATRRRRSFELHATLAEPLREWYQAVEEVDPGRVKWSFPIDVVAALPGPRRDRCDPVVLDRLISVLPALPRTA